MQLLLRMDSDPWRSESEVEEPGTTALQCVLLPSVGKKCSKAGIFLVQRSCILGTSHQSGSSEVMYLAVEVTSNKTVTYLFLKISFAPKTQVEQVFLELMASLVFGFSVVTVETS